MFFDEADDFLEEKRDQTEGGKDRRNDQASEADNSITGAGINVTEKHFNIISYYIK